MEYSSNVIVDVDSMTAYWREKHTRGELGDLAFQRDIAPLIRAACDSYLFCNGKRPQMSQRYRRQVEYMVRLRATSRQVDCIAESCWQVLDSQSKKEKP